jgi:hypothetical protein
VYSEEYQSYIKNQIKVALRHTPIESSEDMSQKEFVQARLFLYIRPESMGVNFFNQFSYYLAPFLTKQLYDPLLTIPFEYRIGDEFQLRLIDELKKNTLDVDVFSGTKPAVVDRNKYVMYRPQKHRIKSSVLDVAGSVIPKFLKPIAKRTYNMLSKDPDDNRDINRRVRESNTNYVLSHTEMAPFFRGLSHMGLRKVNRLHRTIFAVDQISGTKYDSNEFN